MATWKQNYSKARSITWPIWIAALVCFWMAISSVHANGGEFGLSFVVWVAATFGFVLAVRRSKRKYGKRG